MEEKNIKGEYLNLSAVDNQENMKFNLISHDKKYYDFRRKYFDIFLITIIVIIFFIILLLRPNNSNTSPNEINNNKNNENKDNTKDFKIEKKKENKADEKIEKKEDEKNNEQKTEKILDNNDKKDNDINNFEKYKSQLLPRDQAINSGISFLRNCIDGKLINPNSLTRIEKPLISVVIPCYFCQKFIKKAVRSVQNQNFNELKIIIVVDGSDNNTKKTLQQLSDEDPRIELIYNNKRMGILYSRSIGVLNAKGKYVLVLDQDDFFLDYDVFSYLYVLAEKDDLDMIVYTVFEGKDALNKNTYKDNFNNGKEHNLTIYQPELSCHTLMNDGKFKGNDFFVWGKFYKSSIYKSAINMLGKDRYSVFMEWEEDVIITFLIVNVANSYKFVKKYGYFHLFHGGTPTSTLPSKKKIFID